MFFTDVMNHLQAPNLSTREVYDCLIWPEQYLVFRIKLNYSTETFTQNLKNTSLCLKDLSIQKMICVQRR